MQYLPLSQYLSHLDGPQWKASFADIEHVIGFDLPTEARQDRDWWANDWQDGELSPANAWLGVGFETTDVDMAGHRLTFRRIGMELLDPPAPADMADPSGVRAYMRQRMATVSSRQVLLVAATLVTGVAGFLTFRGKSRR